MARILVVEDRAALLNAIGLVLRRAGHDVTLEPNGHSALRHFAGAPTDLVITDVFMPEMDGLDFLERLRGVFPETAVVVMSGGGVREKADVLREAAAAGAAVVVEKPFTKERLLEAVETALAGGNPPPR